LICDDYWKFGQLSNLIAGFSMPILEFPSKVAPGSLPVSQGLNQIPD
jgi:hypothetical protein